MNNLRLVKKIFKLSLVLEIILIGFQMALFFTPALTSITYLILINTIVLILSYVRKRQLQGLSSKSELLLALLLIIGICYTLIGDLLSEF